MKSIISIIAFCLLIHVSSIAQNLSIEITGPQDGSKIGNKGVEITFTISYTGPTVPHLTNMIGYVDGSLWFNGDTDWTQTPDSVTLSQSYTTRVRGLHTFQIVIYDDLETGWSNTLTLVR